MVGQSREQKKGTRKKRQLAGQDRHRLAGRLEVWVVRSGQSEDWTERRLGRVEVWADKKKTAELRLTHEDHLQDPQHSHDVQQRGGCAALADFQRRPCSIGSQGSHVLSRHHKGLQDACPFE